MKLYGLIGKLLDHSFSPLYFKTKFENEKITNTLYQLYPLNSINDFPTLINNNPNLQGLNVTIPFKQQIIPFLDKLDKAAKDIGAVNTVKIENIKEIKILTGYNTDYTGFKQSLLPYLQNRQVNALILGTGGSSQAIQYALSSLGINYQLVSREKSKKNNLTYSDLNEKIIKSHNLIINTTPVGMYPNINDCPDIPYQFIRSEHIVYDLVYNPKETLFLKNAKEKNASIINGLQMLHFQAEDSWKIWNK
ncbi:MAG: shikimate dehydrogenase [Bacteroidota bacterium]|nr:shikimate dehydrogenase [Bacteroidota bacterium]